MYIRNNWSLTLIVLKRKVRKGMPGRPCVKEEEGVYYVY